MKRRTTIDLITEQENGNFVLVAVEQGPWATDEITSELSRLQDRLYDFIDVAVDGHLADKYPDSSGKTITIRLDCYNTPEEHVTGFFRRFVSTVNCSEEISEAIERQGFVAKLEFELNCKTIQ